MCWCIKDGHAEHTCVKCRNKDNTTDVDPCFTCLRTFKGITDNCRFEAQSKQEILNVDL